MNDFRENKPYQPRVTLKEIARLMNRCEKTFRKYVIKYKIPHIRLGRDMLFDVAEVENHLRKLTMAEQIAEFNENSFEPKAKTTKTRPNSNKSKNRYAELLGLS